MGMGVMADGGEERVGVKAVESWEALDWGVAMVAQG